MQELFTTLSHAVEGAPAAPAARDVSLTGFPCQELSTVHRQGFRKCMHEN